MMLQIRARFVKKIADMDESDTSMELDSHFRRCLYCLWGKEALNWKIQKSVNILLISTSAAGLCRNPFSGHALLRGLLASVESFSLAGIDGRAGLFEPTLSCMGFMSRRNVRRPFRGGLDTG